MDKREMENGVVKEEGGKKNIKKIKVLLTSTKMMNI
jgi:hypothetical protein